MKFNDLPSTYQCESCLLQFNYSIPHHGSNYCGLCIVKQMEEYEKNYSILQKSYETAVESYYEQREFFEVELALHQKDVLALAIAQDDTKTLGKIKKLLKKEVKRMPITATTSVQSSTDSARQVVLEAKASNNGLTEAEQVELAQIKERARMVK